MVVVNNFYAYKDAPVTGESKETTNMSAETLSVQVTGLNGTLKVVGATDMVAEDFYPLTGFTLAFDLIDEITTDGIYNFPIDDVARFKFIATGAGEGTKVFCKMTKGV